MRIKPIGVAEGDGGGTTSYSTDGIVYYTPTQAETNYTSFILIAKKTGCIPVAVTVVTTASATPGTVNVALINSVATSSVTTISSHIGTTGASTAQTGDSYAIVNSGTFGNSALKTLIDTVDNFVDTEIADIQNRLPAALVSGRMDVSVGAMQANVLTGFATADSFRQEVADFVWDEDMTLHTTAGTSGQILTDWADGGRLDLILDARASQTSVDDVPTNAELTTALAAADDAVLAAIAALNNLSSAGAASAVTTALTTALTEGYRGTGATGSVRDLLYEIIAHLGESSISSTTKTLKKIDGSTTAKTYTLNDATTPTSITEAT